MVLKREKDAECLQPSLSFKNSECYSIFVNKCPNGRYSCVNKFIQKYATKVSN